MRYLLYMNMHLGVLLAFVAMIFWGLGDFLIQRSTRKVGNFETLVAITLVGTVGLLPFVWRDLPALFFEPTLILIPVIVASVVLFGAAILEFEALREGKLAVVEPIWSLEIPVSIILAYLVIGERLASGPLLIIFILIVGLVLVSYRGGKLKAHHFLEKAVFLAAFSALIMGGANFFMGVAGRLTNSLVINFVASLVILIGSLTYLAFKRKIPKMKRDFHANWRLLGRTALLDNGAWIAFIYAMSFAPIGIVVALSESYIIIAVLLGMFVNKEKLRRHQKIGLIIALFAAIILAFLSA